MRKIKAEGWLVTVTLLLCITAVIVVTLGRDQVVLTPGPCTILGVYTHPDLVGPHMGVDCEGFQFGVKVVVP